MVTRYDASGHVIALGCRVDYAEFQALRAAYVEAIQDIADWAAYASEYFQEKHDLEGTLKLHNDRLKDFASDTAAEPK